MDAEHERVIGRLRTLIRRFSPGEKLKITVGGEEVTITATDVVELRMQAGDRVRIRTEPARLDQTALTGNNPR